MVSANLKAMLNERHAMRRQRVTGYRAVIQRYAKAHNYPPICIKRGKEAKIKKKSNSERPMKSESQHPVRKCNSRLSDARILDLGADPCRQACHGNERRAVTG
jgi:hypothetical protein